MLSLLLLLACKCSGGARPTDTQVGDSADCVPESELCDGQDNAQDCDDDSPDVWDTCCALASDGDFELAPGTEGTLAGGTYSYRSFVVGKGAVLTLTGAQPLVLYSDTVTIDGAIKLRGTLGGSAGGEAGPGGGGGGGGSTCEGTYSPGGAPNGASGAYTGGDGGASYLGTSSASGGGFTTWGGVGGRGGEIEGDASIDTLLSGGGGGGGGGVRGASGGGGGGGLSITAGYISVGGTIDANGGDGGAAAPATGSTSCSELAAGGGGAGGMVRLHAHEVVLTGQILARGGLASTVGSSSQRGSNGSDGWIRVSGESLSISGTVDPSPYSDNSAPACEL